MLGNQIIEKREKHKEKMLFDLTTRKHNDKTVMR